jgi:hypothetical protein
MWIAVVAVVVVALGAVVAKLTWRPSADEDHSVRDYRSALGTIEHLGDRSTVRVLGRTDGEPGAPEAPDTPSVHVQGRPRVPAVARPRIEDDLSSGGPVVFDDERPPERYRRSAEATSDGFRSERARRAALQSMNHRPRRLMATLTVLVLLLAFGALAYVGSHRANHHATASHTTSTTSSTATTGGHSTTTVPRHTPTTTTRPKTVRTTPTTLPTQIVATASTAFTASYPSTTATYVVSLTANSECWVLAKNQATGAVVFTGTLAAGANQILTTTGPMRVELGAPNVTMTLNGIPVVLPTPMQSPFVATFVPPAAPVGSATGSSSPTTAPAAAGATTAQT